MSALNAWLLTLALHTFVLLTLAFALDASWRGMRASWREVAWKAALFGGILTAAAQIALQPWQPSSRWTITSEAATESPSATPIRQSLPVESPQPTVRYSGPGAAAPSRPMQTMLSAVPWWRYALSLWAFGSVLACLRTCARLVRCSRALRGQHVVDEEELRAELAALAASSRMHPPRLLKLASASSALALIGARIVLPDWALVSLSRAQVRAMMAHELGHIARLDPAFKLILAFWCALFWWLPLARVAQRRLDELAELACDAFAAQHTGDERGLAECLAACGEHHVHGPALEFAPGMAARPSSLSDRIERLLEGISMERPAHRALARAAVCLALGIGAFALPGFAARATAAQNPAAGATTATRQTVVDSQETPAKPADAAHGSHSHTSYTDDGGKNRTTISQSDDHYKFRADIDGKIAFTDDESDVQMLNRDGSATFEETRDGVKRRVEIEAKDGQLQRRFFVDGTERPYDDTARVWMKQVVTDMARAGVGAEERVQRLYKQGGAGRVLTETADIPSDYVRRVYLTALIDLGQLNSAELDRVIALAGAMKTDYDRKEALAAIFDKQALDPARQLAFLHQALNFSSDYELAELLIGVLPKLDDSPELRQAWLDAGLKVNADYERRRTLEALVERNGLDDAQLASVVKAISTMKSDYDRRTLLGAVAQRAHDVDALAPTYVQGVKGLSSDYERREALLALIQSGRLGTPGASAVLDGAALMNSSDDCREVLVALAHGMPEDAALEARYREVAHRLSDQDRSDAEKALR